MKKVCLFITFLIAGYLGFAQSTTYVFTNSIQTYTVPAGVTSMVITASGAQGGGNVNESAAGGPGATMSGAFAVVPGHVLNILVGSWGITGNNTGGGGGGSFVWDATAGNTLLIAAGGGGGAGYSGISDNGNNAVTTLNGTDDGQGSGGAGINGNGATFPSASDYGGGGAGWLSNGADGLGGCSIAQGGQDPLNGGAGGAFGGLPGTGGAGGFGGGGGSQGVCSWAGGGGGGGYSGGAGGGFYGSASPGGGGGSYNGGILQTNTVGNTGDGLVTLCPLPSPGYVIGSSSVCSGGANSSTTLSDSIGTPGGFWASSDPGTATVDPSLGTVNGVASGPVTITYTTPSNACGASIATLPMTVNGQPSPIIGSSNFCLSTSIPLGDATSGGTWSSTNNGVATIDGSGNVSGVTTGIDTIMYTLSTGCSTMLVGSVNPTPTLDPVSPIGPFCNTASIASVHFTGAPAGIVTFGWNNSNSSIGLPASGTGDLPTGTATDTSLSSPVVDLLTVTPLLNGCPGTSQTLSVTVNPMPNVNPFPFNFEDCNNTTVPTIHFTGNVATTMYTWTNSNTSIGIPAFGSGDILAFPGTDTSLVASVNAAISVSSADSVTGCTGTGTSFVISIDPTPILTSPLTYAVCDSSVLMYAPSTGAPDSAFMWSRTASVGISNPTNTGFWAPGETLYDTTINSATATYMFVAEAGPLSCVDTQYVVVTVYPHPVLSTTSFPHAVCDSGHFFYVDSSFTSDPISYAWSRDTVVGISNRPAGNEGDTISEYLVNYTNGPLSVPYNVTLTVGPGCSYSQAVTVTVNPKPMLVTPLPSSRLCDSMFFMYNPTTTFTPVSFAWSRAAVAGNPASSGVDSINELLTNHTSAPVMVTYIDTLMASGCTNIQQISFNIIPRLILDSLRPHGICDSAFFNYTPVSPTTGTTFAWARPFVLGIDRAAGSGTDNPNEQLVNTTNDNLNVTYNYTLSDSGCTNAQDVVVVVHPTPLLSSPLTPSVCSGAPFTYGLSSFTFGTTFTWTRAHVAAIEPLSGTGASASINETLTDSLLIPVVTTYNVTLTANGCSHMEYLPLTVNPAPPAAQITTHPNGDLCMGTMYQNFGTATAPPTGQSYTWSATNATIFDKGRGHQYILVNFANSGDAVITLNSNLAGFSCVSASTYTASVGGSTADNPTVVYFDGQLVCLQNSMDSYQWGYDDAITLDSTAIAGEINPNYFVSGLDLSGRYYWVITTHNGCMQKTYYNVPQPTGITNVNAATSLKVYPNPANSVLNIEVRAAVEGNYNVEVMDMLGQKVLSSNINNSKGALDVSSLAGGVYLVVCYRDGVNVGTVRFVKN